VRRDAVLGANFRYADSCRSASVDNAISRGFVSHGAIVRYSDLTAGDFSII
jgi:hypothetical protein